MLATEAKTDNKNSHIERWNYSLQPENIQADNTQQFGGFLFADFEGYWKRLKRLDIG